MRALWRYDNGDLVQYEMRAGGRLRTAQLMRDPIGRVVRATIDGAAHAFAYDAAGQRVGVGHAAGFV
jgi:YD repeat-containing protein